MFFHSTLLLLLVSSGSTLCTPFNPSLEDSIARPSPANITSTLLTSPASSVSISAPAYRDATNSFGALVPPKDASVNWDRPICEDRFGTNLNLDSCYGAISGISIGTLDIHVGGREQHLDVQLPHRMSSSDGTCVFDILLKTNAVSDTTRGLELRTAAKQIIGKCVQSGMHTGGYKRNLGVRKNLIVVMSLYKPSTFCLGSTGARSTSQDLIDQIPTSLDNQVFGRAGAPSVDVLLPKVFHQLLPPSPPLPHGIFFFCRVYHPDINVGVTLRWFDIWAAAVSIDAMCVKQGKAGVTRVKDDLKVQIDRDYIRLPEGNRTVAIGDGEDAEAAWV